MNIDAPRMPRGQGSRFCVRNPIRRFCGLGRVQAKSVSFPRNLSFFVRNLHAELASSYKTLSPGPSDWVALLALLHPCCKCNCDTHAISGCRYHDVMCVLASDWWLLSYRHTRAWKYSRVNKMQLSFGHSPISQVRMQS